MLSVDYYKSSFDVTTDQVVERVKNTILPFEPGSIFGAEGKYDLYGPLWIVITLNVMISVFGNLSCYIMYYTHEYRDIWSYKSEVVKIASSTTFLTFYFLIVPVMIYFGLKFLGESGSVPDYFYFVSIYGYAMAPFMPAIVLYVIPSNTLKWALLLGAGAASLYFMAKEMFGLIAQMM